MILHQAIQDSWINKHAITRTNAFDKVTEKTHVVDSSVQVILAPGECAKAEMSFLKFSDVNLPFSAIAYVEMKEKTGGIDTPITDPDFILDIVNKTVKGLIGLRVNEDDQVIFNVSGLIETAMFSSTDTIINNCDFHELITNHSVSLSGNISNSTESFGS